MKENFNKLVTERARIGSREKFHHFRSKISKEFKTYFNDEELDIIGPKVIKNNKNYSNWIKSKMRHLKLIPVQRFLNKQIGKIWNDVYSQICYRFDKKLKSNQFVFDYLDNWIAKKVYKSENDVLVSQHKFGGIKEVNRFNFDFYVDDEGRLQKTP